MSKSVLLSILPLRYNKLAYLINFAILHQIFYNQSEKVQKGKDETHNIFLNVSIIFIKHTIKIYNNKKKHTH